MIAGLLLLTALAVSFCLGISSEALWSQDMWSQRGWDQFLGLAIALTLWSVCGYFFRRHFLWITLALIVIFTAYAAGLMALAAVALVAVAAIAAGSALFKSANGDWALRGIAGLGVLSTAAALLFRWPINYPVVWFILLGAIVLWRWRSIPIPRMPDTPTLAEHASLCLLMATAILQLLPVLKPEVSADGLAMHLTIPDWIAQHHYWHSDVQVSIWAVMPMGGDWLFAVGYLLGGEEAARLINFLALLLTVRLIFVYVRQWISAWQANLVCAAYLSSPLIQLVTGSLFIENVLAAFCLGAIVAFDRYLKDRRADALLAAFLIGCALATKFGALSIVLPLAGLLIGSLIVNKSYKMAAAAVGLILVAGLYPYVNAWAKTGNPFFPFFNDVFHSPYYDSSRSISDPRFRQPLRVASLYRLTFHSSRYMEGFDGSFGFQYLMLIPLLWIAFRNQISKMRIGVLIGVPLAGALTLLVLLPNLRYLFPVMPLFTLATALALAGAPGVLRHAIAGVLVVCTVLNLTFLPAGGYYHRELALDPLSAGSSDEYLRDAAPFRLLIDRLNEQSKGEPTLFLRVSSIAGLQAPAYSDDWHHEFIAKPLREADTADRVAAIIGQYGIRHIVVPGPESGLPVGNAAMGEFLKHRVEREARVTDYILVRVKP